MHPDSTATGSHAAKLIATRARAKPGVVLGESVPTHCILQKLRSVADAMPLLAGEAL